MALRENRMRKLFNKGFTLIELMIVVVIMGILAAFAYPNYTRYIVESRRSDAQIALTQLAAQEEKFFSQCNSYIGVYNAAGSTVVGCTGFGATYPTTSSNGFYTLSVTVLPAPPARSTSFVATATPVAGTTQAADGAFTITHAGLKQWDKNNNTTFEASEATWKKK